MKELTLASDNKSMNQEHEVSSEEATQESINEE